MTQGRSLSSWTLALLPLVGAGCLLPGPETLVERTSAEVIVTGVRSGDRLRLEIEDQVKETLVETGQPVHLFLELPPGSHEGDLVVERRRQRLCATVSVEVADEAERAVSSVDVRDAERCEPQDAGTGDGGAEDAGADDVRFVYLREEELLVDCQGSGCVAVRVTVDNDGRLGASDGSNGEREASVPEAELAALVEAATAPEADALFAGEDPACAEPRPDPAGLVFLERRTRRASGMGATITERVDVSGCVGVALELRLRLRLLRDTLLPSGS